MRVRALQGTAIRRAFGHTEWPDGSEEGKWVGELRRTVRPNEKAPVAGNSIRRRAMANLSQELRKGESSEQNRLN
jgi:hypothetical protein